MNGNTPSIPLFWGEACFLFRLRLSCRGDDRKPPTSYMRFAMSIAWIRNTLLQSYPEQLALKPEVPAKDNPRRLLAGDSGLNNPRPSKLGKTCAAWRRS